MFNIRMSVFNTSPSHIIEKKNVYFFFILILLLYLWRLTSYFMKKINKLPRTAQYLYSVDDIDGSVNKLYRSKKLNRLYLVTPAGVLSISPSYLSQLSNKILDLYGKIPHKTE